jgi:hypothetical protein
MNLFAKNVGSIDRVARIVAGLALIAFAIFSTSPYALWGFIGIVPLATGLMSTCPAYSLLGLNTCPLEKRA